MNIHIWKANLKNLRRKALLIQQIERLIKDPNIIRQIKKITLKLKIYA